MARRDWSRSPIRPATSSEAAAAGHKASERRFVVTDPHGVNAGGRHYAQGELITRRQGENVRVVHAGGWESWSQWQRVTAPESAAKTLGGLSRSARHDREVWIDAVRKGPEDVQQARRPDSRTAQVMNRFYEWGSTRSGGQGVYHRSDKRPGGPLADYLELIGRRPKGATYNVGETPK